MVNVCTRNRFCKECVKQNVCRYKDAMEQKRDEIQNIINTPSDLPLGVTVSCSEFASEAMVTR